MRREMERPNVGRNLALDVAAWPTPDAHCREGFNQSTSEGATVRPQIALAAKNWKTPHGMAGIDHTGKVGGGGEFAKEVEAWMTPNVPNGGRKLAPGLVESKGTGPDGIKRQVGLENQVELWATPRTITGGAESAERKKELGRENSGGGDLQAQIQSWPSPAARDSKGENSLQHMNRTDGRTDEHESCRPTAELRHAELFAPGPSDPKWGAIIAERPGLAPATQPGVRMLADGAGPAVDESRRDQLRAVGNGAVPLAASLALVILAREAGLSALRPSATAESRNK